MLTSKMACSVGQLLCLGNFQTITLSTVQFAAYYQFGWSMDSQCGSSNYSMEVSLYYFYANSQADPDPALLFYALRFTFFSLSFLNGIPHT